MADLRVTGDVVRRRDDVRGMVYGVVRAAVRRRNDIMIVSSTFGL